MSVYFTFSSESEDLSSSESIKFPVEIDIGETYRLQDASSIHEKLGVQNWNSIS